MLWISALILTSSIWAKQLPQLLTKHALETIRYMTEDGRYTYVQKRPGVLGMVSSFRSIDFLSESSASDFQMSGSRFKKRLLIEVIPNAHQEFNLVKLHRLMVVDRGNTQVREIGEGRSPKLHLGDEWVTFWQPQDRTIQVKNLLTDKTYPLKLTGKLNPFFTPMVEMISGESLLFTQINDKGFASLNQYNLVTKKTNVVYQSSVTATEIEVCQHEGYLAFGEFPFEDIPRNSSIMKVKISSTTNLAGHETIYSSSDQDVGNMICNEKQIYFIKTLNNERKLNIKTTEVVKLELENGKVQVMSSLNHVTQLISMDGKVLAPFRGDFYVVEGSHNLSDDKLKSRNLPGSEEELPLDL
jgi:hypothetical protein